jgi:hypothetical protein
MKPAIPRFYIPLLFTLLANGCQTLPVIPDPLPCPVSAATLQENCSEPVPLADGLTYSDLINASKEDRTALRKCVAHDQQLKNAIRECNTALESYKNKIHEINNDKSKAK